jgi:hypothetical protein
MMYNYSNVKIIMLIYTNKLKNRNLKEILLIEKRGILGTQYMKGLQRDVHKTTCGTLVLKRFKHISKCGQAPEI